MVLRVDLDDGVHIADVGFGGYLIDASLRLATGIEQPTPAGLLQFIESDGAFTLQARLGPAWQDVYRFTLEQQFPIDHEVANWFTSTHPSSRFRNNLLVQLVTSDFRLSLFNRRLTRRHAEGAMEERVLAGPAELDRTLAQDFHLHSPVDAATLFERLPAI